MQQGLQGESDKDPGTPGTPDLKLEAGVACMLAISRWENITAGRRHEGRPVMRQ